MIRNIRQQSHGEFSERFAPKLFFDARLKVSSAEPPSLIIRRTPESSGNKDGRQFCAFNVGIITASMAASSADF